METKICIKCNEKKALENFPIDKRKNGIIYHRNECTCCRTKASNFYKAAKRVLVTDTYIRTLLKSRNNKRVITPELIKIHRKSLLAHRKARSVKKTEKKCTICKIIKPITDFRKSCRCKKCVIAADYIAYGRKNDKRRRLALDDNYIKSLLLSIMNKYNPGMFSFKDITPQLIKLKRKELQFKLIIKPLLK